MGDITKQEGEHGGESGWKWRAQLEGFHPKPLDVHGGWMSSKRKCSAGCKPGSGQPLRISRSSTGLHRLKGRGSFLRVWILSGVPLAPAAISWLAAWQLFCGRDCRLDKGQAERGGGGRRKVKGKQEGKKFINSHLKVEMLGKNKHRQQS